MRDETDSWMLQRRLLQHAVRQEQAILEDKVDIEGMEWALHSLGMLFSYQGKLAEAEAMYEQALQGKEEALGPKHISTLSTVSNLGLLYADQDKLAEAEKMYTRALQGYEEALGPKHTSILLVVNNLGNLYKDQGKLAEAEKMYTRTLQGYEEALGPKHTSTLLVVGNLGNLYADQGKLAEAEAMYSRALQGYEHALGPELLPSYLPALSTIFAFGDLFSRTSRKDLAKVISVGHWLDTQPSKDLLRNGVSGLKIGFKRCKLRLLGRKQARMIRKTKSRSLKSKLRKLGRRLNVG